MAMAKAKTKSNPFQEYQEALLQKQTQLHDSFQRDKAAVLKLAGVFAEIPDVSLFILRKPVVGGAEDCGAVAAYRGECGFERTRTFVIAQDVVRLAQHEQVTAGSRPVAGRFTA